MTTYVGVLEEMHTVMTRGDFARGQRVYLTTQVHIGTFASGMRTVPTLVVRWTS